MVQTNVLAVEFDIRASTKLITYTYKLNVNYERRQGSEETIVISKQNRFNANWNHSL